MKAEELRIGNYVSDIHASVSFMAKVTKITEDRVFYGKGFHTHPNDLKPIHLSEEVLLKCPEITPDEWRAETWTIRDPKSQFHIVKMKGRFVFRGLGMSVTYVDTLHHLQNLVYAVSGEELEVKWS
ncbi:hypothetical protein [Sphingobacterium mizutaii]|uniref:hypothetical protein n=1 Tax=Sphingobacterium mizutaii TaxID=1010 RepID=UPI0028AD7FBA|nr:hypothetical protein [Sphingobacterium mizutaii]